MHKNTSLTALLAFLSAFYSSVIYSKAEPNALDLFLDLPESALRFFLEDGTPEPSSQRRKRVLVQDLPNGYLEVDTKGLDALQSDPIQVALFKKKDGGRVLALAYQRGDSSHLHFYQKQNKQWLEVTDKVLPEITSKQINDRAFEKLPALKKSKTKLDDCASGTYIYKLPRRGTTIEARVSSDCIASGHGTLLFKLSFDGTRFKFE